MMKRISSARKRRGHRLAIFATLAVTTFGLTVFDASAQQRQVPRNGVASKRSVVGFTKCVNCHTQGPSKEPILLPGGVPLQLSDDQWILYRELSTWVQKDKHIQAYTVLLNERSKQMASLLGIKSAHRDKRCLACHTGFPMDRMEVDPDGLVATAWKANPDVNRGVTCEGCHGPSGNLVEGGPGTDQLGWFQPHQVPPLPPFEKTRPWRFLDPKEKQSRYGYVDVRTPSNKARLCGSCHIGDRPSGRVLTHDMYAAGHPPLPGFEPETFTNQMPVHWRSVAKKPAKVRDVFLANTRDPHFSGKVYRRDGLHRTQSMLVGALVSLAQYLELTADLAAESTVGPGWPELAQFECYACHHDLRNPAWRQRRSPPGGAPGRPALREWTTVLARVALGDSRDGQDFKQHWQPVQAALSSVPFGRRAAVAQTAKAAARWLTAQAKRIEQTPLARAKGRAILLAVARAGAAGAFDYDSSRQLIWACRVIDAELGQDSPPVVKQQLKAIGPTSFVLDLRPGLKARVQVLEEPRPRETTEVDLGRILSPIAVYEPARIRRSFAAMVDGLQKNE